MAKTKNSPAPQQPKRKRGDRRDGVWIKDSDPMHLFVPYILPNRADNEAFVTEEIDLTALNEFLAKKNAEHEGYKYTLFHAVAAALVTAITQRPKMNRFYKGYRLYQRNYLSLAFVAKKQFADDAHESLLVMKFDDNTNIDVVNNKIRDAVTQVRSGKREDNSTEKMGILTKMPRWLLALVVKILRRLDFHGTVPNALVKEDPYHATVFISNLGSIKMHAQYHHLTNWGTGSIFLIIGEKHLAPKYDENGFVGMREVMEISITLDERIADGYYYAKTFKLLKHLLHNPELLDMPAGKEVVYE